jgi:maltose phosphorylase
MAGTWLAIVEGFGGMRILDNKVLFHPLIPANWKSYSFHARFRGIQFEVVVTKESVNINNLSEKSIDLSISGKEYQIVGQGSLSVGVK